jgi:hypothetical protein
LLIVASLGKGSYRRLGFRRRSKLRRRERVFTSFSMVSRSSELVSPQPNLSQLPEDPDVEDGDDLRQMLENFFVRKLQIFIIR